MTEPHPFRPLVAVVAYHLGPDRVSRWPDGGYGVPGPYIAALRRAGARTAIISPGESGAAEEILEPFDGLVLVGGGDIDPARYGATAGSHVYGVEPERDAFEIELLLAADSMSMPALCICRGMQVMNVAYGGTLHQHLPGEPGLLEHGVPVDNTQSTHDVTPAPGSRLLGTTGVPTLACSSHHHQGIDRVGQGLVATGTSPDGLVEAIERVVDDPERDTWMLGVQWHPEDTADRDAAQQSLFDGLVNLAKWRGSRAAPGQSHGRTRDYGLVPYDEAWPGIFEREAALIREALGELAVRVDHIGSTSVPGLVAKPVVDIQVSVPRLVPRADFVDPLVSLGFSHMVDPIDAQQEYLTKGYDPEADPKVHVHVCGSGSEWERRHLAFRDWLRAHPADAQRYGRLKADLAGRHPNDIHSYVDDKTEFIRSIEALALSDTKAIGAPPAVP